MTDAIRHPQPPRTYGNAYTHTGSEIAQCMRCKRSLPSAEMFELRVDAIEYVLHVCIECDNKSETNQ